MHILIIHQAFASMSEPGGTRHYEFARLLVKRGHRVTVIASPVSYITGTAQIVADEQIDEISILRVKVYSAHHKSFFHRALAFLSFMVSSFWAGLGVKNVDVVWGTSPPIFQGVAAWILSRIKGAAFLFEVRDLWPQFAIAVGVLKNPFLILLTRWLERFLYRRADRIIVNSPGYLKHVSDRGAKRVELIPNGADPAMFNADDQGARFRQLHKLDDKFVVMYAGAHGMSNDLGVLLDAASLLRRDEVQVVLVGDGKEKPALMAQAVQLGLDNVTFVDPLPKSEMAGALAAADACVAILKPIEEYKTTYPNKVFDYMAAGKPVALAIDGVIREAVEAAGCGVFSKPGNPIELAKVLDSLAQDKIKSAEMGRKGRVYLEENFSRAAIGEKLMETLEGLRRK